MVESGRFGFHVTFGAVIVDIVALGAVLMRLLTDMLGGIAGAFVTAITIFLGMAIHATFAKDLDVLLVIEGDECPILKFWGLIDFFRGFGHVGMEPADDIRHIWFGINGLARNAFRVADSTACLTAPVTVAGKTLAMIGTAETRLP